MVKEITDVEVVHNYSDPKMPKTNKKITLISGIALQHTRTNS
jgi:hypothetical protein